MAIGEPSRKDTVRLRAAFGSDPAGDTAHSWLPYWLVACGGAGNLSSPRILKQALKAHGIHAQGLRLYHVHGDPMFAVLGAQWIRRDCPETSLNAAVALLRLLQDGQVEADYPVELIRAAVAASESLERFERFPVALFRAAWREVRRGVDSGMGVEAVVEERISPILPVALTEWLRNPPDHNQVKQGWTWVRKRFGPQVFARAKPRGKRDWNTPFTCARFGGLDFLPLFNQSALEQEGEQMDHCIADYFNFDRLGRSQHAFSIRHPVTCERLASMGLKRDGHGPWVLDGLSGRRNEDPGEEVARAAEAFLAWMNRRTLARGR